MVRGGARRGVSGPHDGAGESHARDSGPACARSCWRTARPAPGRRAAPPGRRRSWANSCWPRARCRAAADILQPLLERINQLGPPAPGSATTALEVRAVLSPPRRRAWPRPKERLSLAPRGDVLPDAAPCGSPATALAPRPEPPRDRPGPAGPPSPPDPSWIPGPHDADFRRRRGARDLGDGQRRSRAAGRAAPLARARGARRPPVRAGARVGAGRAVNQAALLPPSSCRPTPLAGRRGWARSWVRPTSPSPAHPPGRRPFDGTPNGGETRRRPMLRMVTVVLACFAWWWRG